MFYKQVLLMTLVSLPLALFAQNDLPVAHSEGCSKILSTPLLDQNGIKALLQEHNPRVTPFIKASPTAVFIIASTGLSTLPEVMQTRLGQLDKVKYPTEYLDQHLVPGNYIVIQKAGNDFEFYPASAQTIESTHRFTEASFLESANPALYSYLVDILGPNAFSSGLVRSVLKADSVDMISLQDLGISVEAEVRVDGPYGIQERLTGRNAYLAFNSRRNMYYLIQSDSNGFPIGYIPQSTGP